MLTIDFNTFPQITTDRLLLRQINESDINEVFTLRSNKIVMEFIDRPLAETAEDALQLIRIIRDSFMNNEGITWGITSTNDPKLIGTIGFWRIDKKNHRAEIGYLLHPDFHGKGFMQEAMSEVLDYGFSILKLHSVEANVNPKNTTSIRLLLKNKFTCEAYYKENYYYQGKYLDTAVYSLLTSNENKTR